MRPHRFAVGLITLVASLLFVVPLAKREVFTFRDHSDYFQPLRYYTALSLKQGRLPLWNPYNASGEPWLANPQTAVFYPPALLFVVLPFETAYMLFLLFHLLILGWGAYALFSRFASSGAAMVGAVSLMLCGPTLSLVDISNNLATFAWLPLVLWYALERRGVVVRSPFSVVRQDENEQRTTDNGQRTTVSDELSARLSSSRGTAALILALSFLGGEPFFAFLGAMAFVLITRRLREIVVVGLGAVALAAVQILPFIEFVATSDRSGAFRREDILRDSVPLRDWLRLAIPQRLNESAYDPALTQHFIPMVYVGAIVVVMAAIGALAAFRGRATRRLVVTSLLVLAASVLVATGNHFSPVAAALSSAPLTLFRYPARFIPIGAFAIIAIAVAGFGAMQIRRRWVELIVVGVIIVDLVPRAAPLLQTAAWSRAAVPFDRLVGRTGKIIRLTDAGQSIGADRRAWISGYINLYDRRFDAWTAAPVAARRYTQLYESAVSGPRLDLLDVLPVGWVLADRPLQPPRFTPFDRSGRVVAYQNGGSLPLATFWSRAEVIADDEEAFRALLAGADARKLVVSPVLAKPREEPLEMIGGVEALVLTSTFASVIVNTPRDGVVVLSQQDAPGWRVFVDGKEEKKLLAHGIFRAVSVAAGRHDVLWRYRPASLCAGATITIFAVMWLAFFEWRFIELKSFVKRRRTKKFSSSDAMTE